MAENIKSTRAEQVQDLNEILRVRRDKLSKLQEWGKIHLDFRLLH